MSSPPDKPNIPSSSCRRIGRIFWPHRLPAPVAAVVSAAEEVVVAEVVEAVGAVVVVEVDGAAEVEQRVGYLFFFLISLHPS